MKKLNIVLLLTIFISFACKKKEEVFYQDYIGQEYLDLICKKIPEDWEGANQAVLLLILPNDSIKNQKIPFTPVVLKNIVTEKHLQILLKKKLINNKDVEYFFHSENKNFRVDLLELNINCQDKLFKYIDGRDAKTCFYSQPFYTKDRKVFIFKEVKFFDTKTEINLICVNNRIGRSKILNMSSTIYK